jgi:hypothetical protein
MAASRLPEVISNPPARGILSGPEDGEKDDLLKFAEISAFHHIIAYCNIMVFATYRGVGAWLRP